jgi:23S rRNA (cytosine1962-C5)-methyltransferase
VTKPKAGPRARTQSRHQSPDAASRNSRSWRQGNVSAPRRDYPSDNPGIWLKAGREKSLLRRHPWIFSGAIDHVDGDPASGDTVPVLDSTGQFLAWAAYNPSSQITARVWSWLRDETIDAAFIKRRISQAIASREAMNIGRCSDSRRLVHGESDGLPGLIIDQYGSTVVVQIGAAGPERWRDTIVKVIDSLCAPSCIYERSDSDSRGLEGLEIRNGLMFGQLPDHVEILEHGLKFSADVAAGQKTGFYLDQRDNRALTERYAADREVLNCFCYTGGFSLYAIRGGAKSVLSIDASSDALRIAEQNLLHNNLDASKAAWLEADVFMALRKLRDQGRSFDLIILDPPKFAPTAAHAEKAARGYKDINLLAFKLLRPGGLLFTYSCSGGISADLFQKIVAGAAADAAVDAQIIHHLHPGPDHPVLLSFPEGAYLKGLALRIA